MQHDNSTLFGLLLLVAVVVGLRALSRRMFREDSGVPAAGASRPPVLVRTYKGSAESAAKAFHAQAVEMSKQGYFPVSQSFTPGAWTFGQFLFGLLLCLTIIGIIVFIYMLLVKPDGTLQVTYELRQGAHTTASNVPGGVKTCPRCAETVKEAAHVCRFCGHEFGKPAAAAT